MGLYIAELLLKYALDDAGVGHGQHHDLRDIYGKLPRQRRRGVERRYQKSLNSSIQVTRDVCRTVDSFLQYIGKQGFTDTRYFWESRGSYLSEHASIVFMPGEVHCLVYALIVELHRYPSAPVAKRFDTRFQPLKESLDSDRGETTSG